MNILLQLCKKNTLFFVCQAKQVAIQLILTNSKSFFLMNEMVERALDAVEVSFGVIDYATRNRNYLHRGDASKKADEAIKELNLRFKGTRGRLSIHIPTDYSYRFRICSF